MAGIRFLHAVCLLLCLISVILSGEACFRFSRSTSSSSSSGSHSYDISTRSGLTRLYNQRVTYASLVERPLGGLPMVGQVKHSGVVVTITDGSRWLIHKGGDYGHSSQTVVVDAKHMSSSWSTVRGKTVGKSRVTDYVAIGGAHYILLTDNCHHAAERMMDLS